MFNAIFEVMGAWNQILALIGGLVCFGVAALIILAVVQQRQRCVRVKGKIVAVRCGGTVSGAKNEAAPAKPVEKPEDKKSFRELFKKDPFAGIVALIFAAIVICVPLALFAGGVYFAHNYYHLMATGVKTEAKITSIGSKSDSETGTTYYAVFSFTDRAGNKIKADDRISSSHLSYKRGDKVAIFYDPAKPEHFVTIHFWHNMGLPIGLMGISASVLFFLFGWPQVRKKLKMAKSPGQKKKFSMTEAAGRYYYPVYEYTGPDGKTVRVHTSSGSNSLSNKIPGTDVTILVNPDEPWSAERPGLLVPIFIVLLLAIPGVLFTDIALTKFEFNIFSVLFALGFLAFFAFKIKKLIKPRDQWEKPSEFKQRRREERRRKQENPGGHILSDAEFEERLEALDRYSMIFAPLCILAGVACLAGSFVSFRSANELAMHGLKAQGEVVRMEQSHSSSSDGGYTYRAVVEFEDVRGHRVKFRDGVSANPPMNKPGDVVQVLYPVENPQKAAVDRGMWNWLSPAGFMLGGGLVLWWGAGQFWAIRRRRGRARVKYFHKIT